jgi:imidazolonepropionase-like amidohydrolase
VSGESATTFPPDPPPARADLAIRHARVLPTPDSPPIEDATVLIGGGRILAVEPGVTIPSSTPVLEGAGRVVTAGFWNTHVHFTEQKWRNVTRQPVDVTEAYLHEMLTSRGFTTVVDTGSDLRHTLALRRRIDVGEVRGPSIFTAGPGIYPPRGIPYYLRDDVPLWLRAFIPQPRTPWAARRTVRRGIARGADLVKLFTGSYVERGVVRTMPEAVARAAVESAHARGKLVFSHPSNREGTEVALRAGVDVLAHPPDSTDGVDPALLQQIVDRRMAIVPTLKMFARTVGTSPDYLEPIHEVIRRFRALGGQLLFGTDVGYMTDSSTEEEFLALAECGLDGREILRMLTTAPAERFGVSDRVGAVRVGTRANLVVLDADPTEHPLAFTRIFATIRGGRILHSRR